jgi:glutathione S-transferase
VAALVLYDNPRSSNALKVRFLLAELGMAYERREIPLARPRPDWYLALNPVGGVPALDDGGLVVSESQAILRHLARREGRDDLLGGDLAGRAAVDEFLDRWATGFRAAFFRHEAPALGYAPGGGGFGAAPPDPARAAEAEREIAPRLALLDGLVAPEACVLGRFTLADVAVAPVLHRTLGTGLDLRPYPNLLSLRDTLLARPSFAAAEPVG